MLGKIEIMSVNMPVIKLHIILFSKKKIYFFKKLSEFEIFIYLFNINFLKDLNIYFNFHIFQILPIRFL